MQNVKSYLCSSVGKKQIIALTGLVWSGFVLTHMSGNLLILMGPDTYNKYGHMLVTNPILYPAEAFLVLALLTHMFFAIRLTLENRLARAGGPSKNASCVKAARFGSRSMILTGLLIFVFVILHLRAFKYGPHYTTQVGGVEMRDLHRLVVEEFHEPLEIAWYTFALLVLGIHLSHGFASLMQTFGIGSVRSCFIKKIGWAFAVIVAAGFIIQPFFIYFNLPYLGGGK